MLQHKFCPDCGTKNAADAKFCINCGFNIANLTPPAPANAPAPQPSVPANTSSIEIPGEAPVVTPPQVNIQVLRRPDNAPVHTPEIEPEPAADPIPAPSPLPNIVFAPVEQPAPEPEPAPAPAEPEVPAEPVSDWGPSDDLDATVIMNDVPPSRIFDRAPAPEAPAEPQPAAPVAPLTIPMPTVNTPAPEPAPAFTPASAFAPIPESAPAPAPAPMPAPAPAPAKKPNGQRRASAGGVVAAVLFGILLAIVLLINTLATAAQFAITKPGLTIAFRSIDVYDLIDDIAFEKPEDLIYDAIPYSVRDEVDISRSGIKELLNSNKTADFAAEVLSAVIKDFRSTGGKSHLDVKILKDYLNDMNELVEKAVGVSLSKSEINDIVDYVEDMLSDYYDDLEYAQEDDSFEASLVRGLLSPTPVIVMWVIIALLLLGIFGINARSLSCACTATTIILFIDAALVLVIRFAASAIIGLASFGDKTVGALLGAMTSGYYTGLIGLVVIYIAAAVGLIFLGKAMKPAKTMQ
ncbi:MAG: zinc ribbon domain-containing protein [Ruminococcaceae bacterium]|nr:zinc ribbon domain-containing protein [Oscillospiraceae bacterium]